MSLNKSTNGEAVKQDTNSKAENKDTTTLIPNATSNKKLEGSPQSPEKIELTLSPEQITSKENENDPGLNANNNGYFKPSNDSPSSPAVEASTNTPTAINTTSNQQEKTIAQQNKHFQIGVSEDRNKRCRRTMEDAHSFFYDFAGVEGQGFFAIFDGHAGKQAAEWCGENFHK
ncbi:7896_t:CDS:2, partial [Ambispora leptoticha]